MPPRRPATLLKERAMPVVRAELEALLSELVSID